MNEKVTCSGDSEVMTLQEILETVWVPSKEWIAEQEAWTEAQIEEIREETINEMGRMAIERSLWAYKKYSDYAVGASVLCESGNIYGSFNAEVCVLSGTGHAEFKAIWRAMDDEEHVETGRKFIKAIAVAHREGGGEDWSGPCGFCLQLAYEHCDDALVLVFDLEGKLHHTTSLKTLMPRPFTPRHLGIK